VTAELPELERTPYVRFRKDRMQVVSMLKRVSELSDLVAIRPRARSGGHRDMDAEIAADERLAFRIETNDKLKEFYQSLRSETPWRPDSWHRREKPLVEAETMGYFEARAWRMELCGRQCAGISFVGNVGGTGDVKVHHARCRDRLCPVCNHIGMAGFAASLKDLMRDQLAAGERLVFGTLTASHTKDNPLRSTRRVIDKAWALTIRSKVWRDLFDERIRKAEVEFTQDNGWHPHFHFIGRRKRDSRLWNVRRDLCEQKLREVWARAVGKHGRKGHQVKLYEVRRGPTPDTVYSWIHPRMLGYWMGKARKGKAKLKREGENWYRVQTLDQLVSEVCKYVTKPTTTAAKHNQVGFYQWTPKMVREYALGVAGWNLLRASKGWEKVIAQFDTAQDVKQELAAAAAGGRTVLTWAQIAELCQRAARHELTGQEDADFAARFPYILKALEKSGCDVAADQIRGYIFRYFGEVDAPLREFKRRWSRPGRSHKSLSRMADKVAVRSTVNNLLKETPVAEGESGHG